MKLRKKILITVSSVLFTILVVLPGLALAVLKWFILPPEKLTPIVLNIVDPMIDGEIKCKSIELTFFETFPKIGLKITDGRVISHSLRDSVERAENIVHVTDTLLSFSTAVVTVDIMDYLRRDRITIDRLGITDPFFYGFTDGEGRANWDIVKPDGTDDPAEPTEADIPVIDLQKAMVRNGHFIYEDLATGIYFETRGFELRMRNVMTKGNLKVDIKAGTEALFFESPEIALREEVGVHFESRLDMSRGRIAFEGAWLRVNDLPFSTDGVFERADSIYHMDFSFDFTAGKLADLIDIVPDEYFDNRNDITTGGSLALRGHLHGYLGDGLLPDLRLGCTVENAVLRSKMSAHGIERLDADVDLYLNSNHPDSSFVSFDRFYIKGTNTVFSASGKVEHMLTDPYVDARLEGTIDFAGIVQDIINPDSMVVRGRMDADIEAAFKVGEIANGNFANMRAAGKFEMERLLVADRVGGMSLFLKGVEFSADTTRRQSRYLTDDDLFGASLRIDTLNVRYLDQIQAKINRLDVQVKTSRSIDTTRVVPVTTTIRMDALRARMPDSVWLTGTNVIIAGGLKSSAFDRKKAVFAGTVLLDTLRYFDIPARTRMTLERPNFNLEITPLSDAFRRGRAADTVSRRVGTVIPTRGTAQSDAPEMPGRPSRSGTESRRHTENVSERGPGTAGRAGNAPDRGAGNFNGTAGTQGGHLGDTTVRRGAVAGSPQADISATDKFLRNWQVRGSVKFNAARLMTAMFPLPVSMGSTTLRFDTDKVTLTDAALRAGRSDFLLDGEIMGLRRAKLRNGTVEARLTLTSEYIDCNQLMRAINLSTLLAGEVGENVQIADTSRLMSEERLIESWEGEPATAVELDMEEQFGVFVVPRNIDLVLRTSAKKVDFQDVELRNIEGEIIVRNQSVNLRRLNLESGIGSGNLTMVYTARDRSGAGTGFELELNDIIVEDLIDLFPSIDTLLPMLRSFEGVLDCQISATAELDSAMNLIMPSLHSACYLNGENMVLMDGKTFAEISKKLMFKNKEGNLIDYISVDLLVKDNKIEIFPFMVEIDRYKLAVGGVHNLDMTFDYHISVIKSPVPFKLGLDVKGDLDDFKFKIVKCRYKNLFTAAREQELAQTRVNMRSVIRESIIRQLRDNAPELAEGYGHDRIRTRRPEPVVADETADAIEIDDDDGDHEEKYSEYLRQMELLDNPGPDPAESAGPKGNNGDPAECSGPEEPSGKSGPGLKRIKVITPGQNSIAPIRLMEKD